MKFNIMPFVESIRRQGLDLDGVAVQQHGKTVGEYRFCADTPHQLYSLSKSFTSTAIGMAVDDGILHLDDRAVDFFLELLPGHVSDNLAALTLENLLTLASGHLRAYLTSDQRRLVLEPDWVKYFLAQPFEVKPGSRFVYDTGCTYVAGAMLQKACGRTVSAFLNERFFSKLGLGMPAWDECPLGRSLAGAGLYLKTAQLLPFGQFYLQNGVWEGERLLSQGWIDAATSERIKTYNEAALGKGKRMDNEYGYGYQFWMGPCGTFRGDGMLSQLCVINRRLDSVVAITAEEQRTQDIFDTIRAEIDTRLEASY